MRIVEITREQFPAWRRMREALYHGLSPTFHEREMELILASAEASCFLGYDATDAPVAMLEVSLRNFVDGCLGGPVGYIEGIYLDPAHRGKGEGRRLVRFAADWFRRKGCRDMAADAELENEAAQCFWQRAGFEETFRIIEYRQSLDAPFPPLEPKLADGEFVFLSFPDGAYGDRPELHPIAAIREAEGLTLVVPRQRADAAGFGYEAVFRMISLGVHSSLSDVGLTAAVARRLADRGISANVAAAFHHDHILVPADRAQEAFEELSLQA